VKEKRAPGGSQWKTEDDNENSSVKTSICKGLVLGESRGVWLREETNTAGGGAETSDLSRATFLKTTYPQGTTVGVQDSRKNKELRGVQERGSEKTIIGLEEKHRGITKREKTRAKILNISSEREECAEKESSDSAESSSRQPYSGLERGEMDALTKKRLVEDLFPKKHDPTKSIRKRHSHNCLLGGCETFQPTDGQ